VASAAADFMAVVDSVEEDLAVVDFMVEAALAAGERGALAEDSAAAVLVAEDSVEEVLVAVVVDLVAAVIVVDSVAQIVAGSAATLAVAVWVVEIVSANPLEGSGSPLIALARVAWVGPIVLHHPAAGSLIVSSACPRTKGCTISAPAASAITST
jgi:hypothetical protein